jgi:hypothetical protein
MRCFQIVSQWPEVQLLCDAEWPFHSVRKCVLPVLQGALQWRTESEYFTDKPPAPFGLALRNSRDLRFCKLGVKGDVLAFMCHLFLFYILKCVKEIPEIHVDICAFK